MACWPFLIFSLSLFTLSHVSTFTPFPHVCLFVSLLSLFLFVHVLFPVFHLSPLVLSFSHSPGLGLGLGLGAWPWPSLPFSSLLFSSLLFSSLLFTPRSC